MTAAIQGVWPEAIEMGASGSCLLAGLVWQSREALTRSGRFADATWNVPILTAGPVLGAIERRSKKLRVPCGPVDQSRLVGVRHQKL